MKKKKVILPTLAILLALIGAASTGFSTSKHFINEPVTIDDEECLLAGRCTNNSPGTPCQTEEGEDLFVIQTQISCLVPATGIFDPED